MSTKSKNRTILLVDDDEMIRLITGEMLSFLGFEILSAEGAAQAIDLFRENREEINLIILDLLMPEMSGAELFRKIREFDKTIPIIISSGIDELSHKNSVADLGVAAFLEKPYTLEDLKKAINPILPE